MSGVCCWETDRWSPSLEVESVCLSRRLRVKGMTVVICQGVLPCRGQRTIVEKSVGSRRRTIVAEANDQLCQPVESDYVPIRNDFRNYSELSCV